MARPTGADLYRSGMRTLVASWQAFAVGSPGAAVTRFAGVATAVFPAEPERSVFNNALLDRGLPPAGRADALDAMEAAYGSAAIPRFAAWVHESDEAMRRDLDARGYRIEESTRSMSVELADLRLPRPRLDLAPPDWPEHLRILEVPAGLLARVDPSAFHVLTARLDGRGVSTAMAFDHAGDCGVYNVSTLPPARRRGLATALTTLQLHAAVARGRRTASLQSSEMAERVYAAAGFRDLGRILEYTPTGGPAPDAQRIFQAAVDRAGCRS